MEDVDRQRALINGKKAELGIKSNDEFAARCGLTGGTIQKFLSGVNTKLSTHSKAQIDNTYALGLSASTGVARKELGSYSRASVELDIAGMYTTIRMSPADTNTYYAYKTEIKWCEIESCLIFKEINRNSKNQHSGNVAVFPFSQILHLFTYSKNGHGYRLVNVKRNINDKKLSGFVLTLFDPDLLPMVSPIVYVKDLELPGFGSIRMGHASFDGCKSEIAECLKSDRSKLLLPDEFQLPKSQ